MKTTNSLDAARLVRELEVHKIELELQNEELRESRTSTEEALARYTELFELAPIGYATLDAAGMIVDINRAGGEILGRPRPCVIGAYFMSYVQAGSLRRFKLLFDAAADQLSGESSELEIVQPNASIAVRLRIAAVPRGGRYLVAFEDISDLRSKADALARSEQALREQNHRKDEFIAMLSHELRSPLSPIGASIFVLRSAPPGSETSTAALGILERSAEHLTRLVDDLLDVTRIARGKFELQREVIELGGLLRRTIEDHRPAFTAKGVRLALDAPLFEASVNADAARLVQVLSNVLGNAEKFTPPGGKVTVTATLARRTVTIKIRDTGIGIAPEVIDTVFDAFAQAPQPLDRPNGGLGLGLALVKAVIGEHGGSVTIHSEGVGHGTEVVIMLEAEEPKAEPVTRATRSSDQPRRVLVVEDKHDAAEALRFALSLKGHHVDVARDGRTAVELARTVIPDVVLCDLGLPDMDGYEVARTLRKHSQLASVCLIALSGYARPEDVTRAREAGFDRHLAKPPRLDELFELLATAKST